MVGNDGATRNSTGIGTAFDSFTYSPDGRNMGSGTPGPSSGSPLQDFMRAQTTNQIVKYQKIVEDHEKWHSKK